MGKILNNMNIKREMNYERVFLRGPSYVVSMLARLKGEILKDQIEAAILKVQKRHPMLNVRIEFDYAHNAWFVSDGINDNIIKVVPRIDNSHWIELIKKENFTPFRLDEGPLIKFILLNSPDISDLVVYSHHSICDGLSLVYLIKDILNYIVNPKMEVKILPAGPVINKNVIKRGDYGNFLFKLIVKLVNKIWKKKKISFDEDDFNRLNQKFWNESNISVNFWNLEKIKTSILIRRCQKEKVTVNSALCASFLAAQNETQGNSSKYLRKIALPVNIRDRLVVEVGENFGCYTSGSFIKLKYQDNKPFWENVGLIHKKINHELDNFKIKLVKFTKLHPTLIDALNFYQQGECDEKILSSISKASKWNKLNAGFSISNLGRLNIPLNYDTLQLKAIYGPVTYDPRIEKFIGINTINDNIFFALTYRENIIKRQIIEDFIDYAMLLLEKSLDL
ncbi:MAG: hypothetical protein EU551_02205 [Promethearchaeota archaeon]|nr:MAG: hypothetical protein EU551_02205 [Candidatus Lokiarchaeota archaeon]